MQGRPARFWDIKGSGKLPVHNWHGEAIDRGAAGSDESFATPGSNAAAVAAVAAVAAAAAAAVAAVAVAATASTERVLAAPGFTLGNVAIYRPSCRCGEEEDWGTSPDVSTKFNSFVAASRPNRRVCPTAGFSLVSFSKRILVTKGDCGLKFRP